MTRVQKAALAAAAALTTAWYGTLVAFVVAHGRFPAGAGEVLNWAVGL